MTIVFAVLVLVFLVVLAVGALTGRVRGGSCCAAADPRRDLRMRDAFTDELG
jgi:Na+-transporting methylmalonyl-CoA/oxaloacetate decarboxylase gamma subunit